MRIDPANIPIIAAAIAIAMMGGALSIFVVLKRLAFIGQGISHAAFGGVGIALVLGVHGATTVGAIGQLTIVVVFSILAALWIAALSRSHKGRTDTAIGVVLSASMALGFVLFTIAESRHDHDEHGHAANGHEDEHHLIEEILFGNILNTTTTKSTIAVVTSAAILLYLWSARRKLIFWAFDEPVVDAYGHSSRSITNLFLSVLAIAVVMSMQIAGVVLAAAILVLPGAAALNLTAKLRPAFIYAITIGVLGAILGLQVGLNSSYPIGPTIVLIQSVMYLLTLVIKLLAPRLRA
ncbi:MAG: metal ABC transporter permease [Phycisphaerales bacterium]|nr:metal ABC transporter permease [Phycisphaerales bacterium]